MNDSKVRYQLYVLSSPSIVTPPARGQLRVGTSDIRDASQSLASPALHAVAQSQFTRQYCFILRPKTKTEDQI